MLVAVIVACEVAFWVFLFGGLAARYLLRRPRLGAALLVSAPLVDLVVLTAGVLDMRSGATAGLPHVLAAVYLGVSVGFGHRLLHTVDVRFAHRFAGGPAPEPKPRYGTERAAYERQGWYRHLRAWAVGAGLMLLAVVVVGDPGRTAEFTTTALVWTVVLVVDGVVSFAYTVWPKRPPADVQWQRAGDHGVLGRTRVGRGQRGR